MPMTQAALSAFPALNRYLFVSAAAGGHALAGSADTGRPLAGWAILAPAAWATGLEVVPANGSEATPTGTRPYPPHAQNGHRLEGERSRRQNAPRNERKGCGILQQECRDAISPASVPRPSQERDSRRPAHTAQMNEVGNVVQRAPIGRVDMALPGRDSIRPTADLAGTLAANRNGRKRYAAGRCRVGRSPGTCRGSR